MGSATTAKGRNMDNSEASEDKVRKPRKVRGVTAKEERAIKRLSRKSDDDSSASSSSVSSGTESSAEELRKQIKLAHLGESKSQPFSRRAVKLKHLPSVGLSDADQDLLSDGELQPKGDRQNSCAQILLPDVDPKADWLFKPVDDDSTGSFDITSSVRDRRLLRKFERKQESLVKEASIRNMAVEDVKRLKEEEEKMRRTPEGQMKFLLNKDPYDKSKRELDEEAVMKLIAKNPEVCKKKIAIDAFEGKEVYPLSMLCALGASLPCIKKCYKNCNAPLTEPDSVLGTAVHYACMFRAKFDVIQFFVRKDDSTTQILNENGRSPLHVACMARAREAVIDYLIAEDREVLKVGDKYKMTPLHLACKYGYDDEDVIVGLVGAYRGACVARAIDGSTPLHVALKEQSSPSLIKILIKGDPEVMAIKDKKGRIPLHVAAANDDYKAVKLLVKKFPDAIFATTKAGETPYDLAKKVKARTEIRELLAPRHAV